ncbi:MAG: response regulator transcription factor [Actinobacteria bacterium]|nr:response regulator transcription factor [Actinomycetota bacterium]
MALRLVLADDHPVVREGLRALLDSEPDFEVVGQADNGEDVAALVDHLHPDVVVLDLMMGGTSGLDVTRELAERSPATRVLILSMHKSEAYVLAALRSGASGYALKQAEAAELGRGIREVAAGRRYLSPPLSERALEAYSRLAGEPADPYDTLTHREQQVLQLVSEGLTNADVGERLYISTRTVETHRAHAMKKLGLRNPVDLALYAVRRGIVPREP